MKPIAQRQDLLTQFIADNFPTPNAPPQNVSDAPQMSADEEICRRAAAAANGEKFRKLWAGEWRGDYPSQSEADQALVNIIAFYTKNHAQIARMFRNSGLGQRDKAQRDDYMSGMIGRGLDREFALITHDLSNQFNAVPQTDTLDLNELLRLAETTPPRLFTTTFLTPVGEVTLLSANGGVGKTIFALIWAICLAFGVAGLPVQIAAAVPVLFVTAEDTALECGRRVKAIFEALRLNMAGTWAHEGSTRFHLWDVDGAPLWVESRESPAGTATPALVELERRIAATGAKQVFIDNASSVFHANHNDLTAVNAFVGALRRVAARTDCNIVLLAHVSAENATKGGAKTYYGSAAWHNSVRSRMFMDLKPADNGIPEHIIVVHEKSNYGAKAEPFKLKRDPETGVLSTFSNHEIASAIDEGMAPFVEQLFAHILAATQKGEAIRAATSGSRTTYHSLAELFPKDYPEGSKDIKQKVRLAVARLSESGRIVKRKQWAPGGNDYQSWVVLPPEDPLYGKGV